VLLDAQLNKDYFYNSKDHLKHELDLFLEQGAKHYTLLSNKAEDNVIEEIKANKDVIINATLYNHYADNLRKAIDSVFRHDDYSNILPYRLKGNLSQFAAYKAYHATQQILTADDDNARKVLHKFNRYQAAEYNTAVARSRTAKQFTEFNQSDHKRLFPNLRWLPSRSANIRQEHAAFYNRVWSKDDPFWNSNQPGCLWNCKCDWQETNDPVTDGNPATKIHAKGLDGNPAVTGEIYSDESTYIAQAPKGEDINKNITKVIRDITQDWLFSRRDLYTFKHPSIDDDIKLSGKGIKKLCSSFQAEHFTRFELIKDIDNIIKESEYIGYNTYKKRNSYYFKTKIAMYDNLAKKDVIYYAIVLKDINGFWIYTLTPNLGKNLKK
jgi:hypothetical protein